MQEHVTFTLNKLVNSINSAADQLLRRNLGMTYRQFLFLVTLDGRGALSSAQLAGSLGVSAAAVSQRLSWFDSRGLIVLGHSERDHRLLTVELSARGRELAHQATEYLEGQFRSAFQGFSAVKLDGLHEDLNAVLAHFHTHTNHERLIA